MQVLGRLRAGPTSVGKLQSADRVRLERAGDYRPGCCRGQQSQLSAAVNHNAVVAGRRPCMDEQKTGKPPV